MKHTLSLAALLLIALTLDAKTTILRGHLDTPAAAEVSLQYYATPVDFIESLHTQFEAELDKDNNFFFSFDIDRPVNLSLRNGKNYLFYNIFITPGDSINLTFSTDKIDIAGRGENGMGAMFDHMHKFLEGSPLSEMQNSFRTLEPIEFAQYWTRRMDSELAFYDASFKKDPVSDEWRNVIRKEVMYQAAVNMLQYPFRGRKDRRYRNLLSDSAYLRYIIAIPFDDASALACDMYSHYLRELPYNMWECKNDTSYFDSVTNNYNSRNQFRLRDSVAKALLKGEAYDIALYNILHDGIRVISYFKGSNRFDEEYEKTAAEVDRLSASFNDKNYAEQIHTKLAALKEKDKPAPDFTAYTPAGAQAKLSDYKGKVVYLDFWATSCAPCVAEIPHAKKLQEKYKDKNIVFLYVSLDNSKETWNRFITERSFPGTHLVAPKGFQSEPALKYNIAGIPRHILVDKNGLLISADAPRPSQHPEELIDNALGH